MIWESLDHLFKALLAVRLLFHVLICPINPRMST